MVTEYEVPGPLEDKDLKELVNDTIGQWSDAIGEGEFSKAVAEIGIHMDLWPVGQDHVLQVEKLGSAKLQARSPSSLLPKAVRDGDLEKVRALLNAGADVQTVSQGFPVLQIAILYAHTNVAMELIARGADIHALNKIGHHDALMCCALSNQNADEDAARIGRSLLERGADPHRPRGKPSANTPLFMAKNRKKQLLEKVLREFGATE